MFLNASLCVRVVFPACQWEIIIIKCFIRTPLVCCVENNFTETWKALHRIICGRFCAVEHIDIEHPRSLEYIWKTVDTSHCSQSGYSSSWVLGPYPQCEAEIYWGKASGRLSCQRQSVSSSGWERLLCGAFIRNLSLKVFQIYQSLLSTQHACSLRGTAESSGPFFGSYPCPILSDIAWLCASLVFVLMLISKPYIFTLMGMP